MTDENSDLAWNEDVNLALVFFTINNESHSETGCRALDAMFGSSDGPYIQHPDGTLPTEISVQWIKALDENLKRIRNKSKEYQDVVYHPGELVLWQ